MRNLVLTIIFIASAQTLNAQSTGKQSDDLKGRVKQVTEYVFMSKNNQKDIDTATAQTKEIDTLNMAGFFLKKQKYGLDGFLMDSNIYHYLSDTLTTADQYDSKGKLMLTYSYKYNSKNQLVEYDMPFPYMKTNGAIIFSYLYNTEGKTIKTVQYNTVSNKIIMIDSAIYTHAPQMIEHHNYFTPNSMEKMLIYCDASHRVIKTETYDQSGSVVDEQSITYADIDKNGNWLSKIIEKKGHNRIQGSYSNKIAIKREITYY